MLPFRRPRPWSFLVKSPFISPPADQVNQEGIKFYNDFIDALLKSNVTPVVTLHHWDLPQVRAVQAQKPMGSSAGGSLIWGPGGPWRGQRLGSGPKNGKEWKRNLSDSPTASSTDICNKQ